MGKTIYIAVGSTAIKGLSSLIRRQIEENIYHSSNDVFIALDSDRSRVDKFCTMDKDRSRVLGLSLRLDSDAKSISLAEKFQPTWAGLSIPPDGVGGDRRRSFAALDWYSDTNFNQVLQLLGNEDTVVLVGTAFGGTSTGMYLNAALLLRRHIEVMVQGLDQSRNIEPPRLYGMLVLPESPRVSDTQYPTAGNLCAFLKDLMQLEWGVRLSRFSKTSFKYPMFPIYSGGDNLPLFSERKYGKSPHTNLPLDHIFIIPTRKGKQGEVPTAIAEFALLLNNLKVWDSIPSKLIDRYTNCTGTTNLNNEDPVMGGLNMVTARSSRTTALKRRYYQQLEQAWNAFFSDENVSTNKAEKWILDQLDELLNSSVDLESYNAVTEKVRSAIRNHSLAELNNELSDLLIEMENSLATEKLKYSWPGFDALLVRIFDNISGAPGDLSIAKICKVYSERIESIRRDADRVKIRRDEILDQTRRARSLIKRRQNSTTAKIFGCGEIVAQEVQNAYAVAMEVLLDGLIGACRAMGSLKTLTTTVDVTEEKDGVRKQRYAEIAGFIRNRLTDYVSNYPDFIYEDTSVRLDLSMLDISGKFNFNEVIMDALMASSSSALADNMENYERLGVEKLSLEAEKLDANDPLKKLTTTMDPEKVNSFSKSFRREIPNKYTFHYYLQYGEASSLTWDNLISEKDFNFKSFQAFGLYRANDTFNPDSEYDIDESLWIHRTVRDTENIHGLWVGTATIDDEVRDTISRAYSGMPTNSWQQDSANKEEKFGGEMPRLMSLKQFVYLGSILGAIEEKILEKCPDKSAAHGMDVKLVFNCAGKKLELPGSRKLTMMFETDPKFEFDSCPVEWIPIFMEWINTTFEEDLNLKGAERLGGILLFENNILTSIRMGIDDNISHGIVDLVNELKNCIEIA